MFFDIWRLRTLFAHGCWQACICECPWTWTEKITQIHVYVWNSNNEKSLEITIVSETLMNNFENINQNYPRLSFLAIFKRKHKVEKIFTALSLRIIKRSWKAWKWCISKKSQEKITKELWAPKGKSLKSLQPPWWSIKSRLLPNHAVSHQIIKWI